MPATPRAHGTEACYNAGCRRQECKDARNAAQRRRHRLKGYGRWQPWTDPEPVRRHVRELMASGLGAKRIAEVAGVGEGTINRLLWGRADRQPTAKIRPDSAAKILAVKPSPALLRPGRMIDGTGTRRRLQALIAAGHSRADLADRLGRDRSNFNHLVRGGGAGLLFKVTAETVKALYDEVWNAAPDESTPAAARRAARARAEGLKRGWPLPAAWDDEQIDDPAAPVPDGWQRRDTKLRDSAALVEDADELTRLLGYDRVQAAERLGVTRHALDKAYARTEAKRAAEAATQEDHAHAA